MIYDYGLDQELDRILDEQEKIANMDKTKCITFDKATQDALPEHIKAKMKADREKARKEQEAPTMTCIHCVFCRFNKDILRWFCAAKSVNINIANLHIINSKDKACEIFE